MAVYLTAHGLISFQAIFQPRPDSPVDRLCQKIDHLVTAAYRHRAVDMYAINLQPVLDSLSELLFQLAYEAGDLTPDPLDVGMTPTNYPIYTLLPIPLHGGDAVPDQWSTQCIASACLMACTETLCLSFATLHAALCAYVSEAIHVPPSISTDRNAPKHPLKSTAEHRSIIAKCDAVFMVIGRARAVLERHPEVRKPLATVTLDGRGTIVSPFLQYVSTITEATFVLATVVSKFAGFMAENPMYVDSTGTGRSKVRLVIRGASALLILEGAVVQAHRHLVPTCTHVATDQRIKSVMQDIALASHAIDILVAFTLTNQAIYNMAHEKIQKLRSTSARAKAVLELLERFEMPNDTARRLQLEPVLMVPHVLPALTTPPIVFPPGPDPVRVAGSDYLANGFAVADTQI
jgi:hypothetical protein